MCFLFPGFWHIQIKTQVTSKPVNMLNCLWLHEKLCLETGIESRMPVSHEGIPTKIIILPFWWGGSTDSSKFLSTVSKIEFYHPKDNDKINSVLQKSQKYSFWYHFSSWLKTLKVNTFLILIIDSHSLVSWAPLLVGSLWLLSMLCMWPSEKKPQNYWGKKYDEEKQSLSLCHTQSCSVTTIHSREDCSHLPSLTAVWAKMVSLGSMMKSNKQRLWSTTHTFLNIGVSLLFD